MGARHGLALSAEEEALYAEIDQIDVMRSPAKKVEQSEQAAEETPVQSEPQVVAETPITVSSSVIASVLGTEEETAAEKAADEGEADEPEIDPAEIERQERLARAARQRRRNRNR